jgi:arsenate reductase-like glutaredoxin family protein
MNYIIVSGDELTELQSYITPSCERMNKVLSEFNFTMVSFVEHISNEKLWIESAREFFSDHDKCIKFLSNKLIEYYE